MPSPDHKLVRNRLLSILSDEDYQLIQRHLEPVTFKRGEVLIEPNAPSVNLHFIESGLASQIAVTTEDRKLEVGIYGRDGVGPASIFLGVDRTPHQLVIQVEGHGFLIEAKTVIAIFDQSPAFRALIMRYIQTFTVQTGYTALSNGSGVIGERLARWLLMCHDRVDGDDLPLTHEFLGIMLGVRRSGVTDAIHLLEGVNIIRATRGNIRVLDREKLEDTAGDSYGVPESEYRRLIGSFD
jgi:CRP-like cAMP-binding protein